MNDKCLVLNNIFGHFKQGKCLGGEEAGHPYCIIPEILNRKTYLFHNNNDPNIDDARRELIRKNLEAGIAFNLEKVKQKELKNISWINLLNGQEIKQLNWDELNWDDFYWCSNNLTNQHFSRKDLFLMNYDPEHLITNSFLDGITPIAISDKIPIFLDKYFSKGVVFLFILVFVFAALLGVVGALFIYKKRRMKRNIANAPGSSFSKDSEDITDTPDVRKYKDLVRMYESKGYYMYNARKKLKMDMSSYLTGNSRGA